MAVQQRQSIEKRNYGCCALFGLGRRIFGGKFREINFIFINKLKRWKLNKLSRTAVCIYIHITGKVSLVYYTCTVLFPRPFARSLFYIQFDLYTYTKCSLFIPPKQYLDVVPAWNALHTFAPSLFHVPAALVLSPFICSLSIPARVSFHPARELMRRSLFLRKKGLSSHPYRVRVKPLIGQILSLIYTWNKYQNCLYLWGYLGRQRIICNGASVCCLEARF